MSDHVVRLLKRDRGVHLGFLSRVSFSFWQSGASMTRVDDSTAISCDIIIMICNNKQVMYQARMYHSFRCNAGVTTRLFIV